MPESDKITVGSEPVWVPDANGARVHNVGSSSVYAYVTKQEALTAARPDPVLTSEMRADFPPDEWEIPLLGRQRYVEPLPALIAHVIEPGYTSAPLEDGWWFVADSITTITVTAAEDMARQLARTVLGEDRAEEFFRRFR